MDSKEAKDSLGKNPRGVLFVLSFLILFFVVLELLCPLLGFFDPLFPFLVWEVRLPRVLSAFLAGSALGLSGAVLQAYFRNPLAEPSILGVSSMASLGAVLALYTGLYALFPLSLPLLAMGFAFLLPLVFLAFAKSFSKAAPLILVGIAVSSFVGALISLLLNFMEKNYALLDIIFWMFGSFADHTYQELGLVLPFWLLGIVLLLRQGPDLDLLSFGVDTAITMGTSLKKVWAPMVSGVALAVGSTVALTGVVGFIGLVTPHVLRLWVGERPRNLLWPSALGGGLLALVSDGVVRFLPTTGEVKVGVITALIGAPFLVYLVKKTKHAVFS